MKKEHFFLLGALVQQFCGLLIFPLILMNLSLEEFGKYSFYCSLSLFFVPIISLCIYQCITAYYVSWCEEDLLTENMGRLYWSFFIISTFQIILLFCLAYLFKSMMGDSLFHNFCFRVLPFGLLLAAQALVIMFYRMSDNANKYFYHICFSVFSSLVGKATYLCLCDKCTVSGLLLIDLFANSCFLFSIIAFLIKNRISPKLLEFPFFKKSVLFVLPICVSSVLLSLKNILDQILISALLGFSLLGVYSYVMKFYGVISGISSSLKNVYIPKIIKQHKDRATLSEITYKYILYSGVASILVVLFAIPFTKMVASNQKYITALDYLPLYLIVNILFILYLIASTGVAISRNSKPVMKIHLFSVLGSLLSLLIMIRSMGIYAVIISTIIFYSITLFLYGLEYKTFKIVPLPNKLLVVLSVLFLIVIAVVRI